MQEVLPPEDNMKKLKELTVIVYALHAASFLCGGITLLVAVIINYVKRDDTRGTYLESHFSKQIATFWIVMVVGFVGVITLPIFIGFFILMALSIWFIVRIVKGWVALNDNKPVT